MTGTDDIFQEIITIWNLHKSDRKRLHFILLLWNNKNGLGENTFLFSFSLYSNTHIWVLRAESPRNTLKERS